MLLNYRLILYTSWRYLVRHAVQSILMVIGISMGVAVAVSIDLANESASRALTLSTDTLAGKATHQITQLPGGLDEQVYRSLKLAFGTLAMTPRVNGIVQVEEMENRPFTLMGIDPISEIPFGNYLGLGRGLDLSGMTGFFTQPGAAVISRQTAEQYHIRPGDNLTIKYDGNDSDLFVIGIITSLDTTIQQSMEGIILTDIATAQEVLGSVGRISQIDLILADSDPALYGKISAFLPTSATFSDTSARSAGINQMTAAFQLNLTALSLLAMMVGMFLIYNTMTFSVIQRRRLFGTLRSLGVTRREIFAAVVLEALLVGLAGSVLGLAAGIFLGKSTIGMVSQTVNDLYYTTTVRDIALPVESLYKGILLGIMASLFTAIPPAIEASTVPASEAITRISLENKTRKFVMRTSLAGLGAFLAGWGILSLPTNSLYAGFGGLMLVVLAFALVTGVILIGLMRMVAPITRIMAGLVGKLAPRNLVNSLSRTSIAVAALMVALAVSIGVNLMIDSFRYTVNTWLNASLLGDIYLTAPNFKSNQPTANIDEAVLAYLQGLPGVERLDLLKIGYVASPNGEIQISATDNYSLTYERLYKYRWMDTDQLWGAMEGGGVLISEPLAFRLGIDQGGQTVALTTRDGVRNFPVLGVYYDYTSTSGLVQMTLDQYRHYWNDNGVSAIGVRVTDGTDVLNLSRQIRDSLPTGQALEIQPNQELRDEVMVVFDRTFAITRALQVLATLVAFVGILNSLSLLQFEKQREIGIIRALGFTPGQLWGLVMLETGLMGLVSGLIAMPAGITLAYILVEVINRRSFGWSLQLALSWQPFIQAMAVALLAALLAGLAPARKLSRIQTVEAIHYE